MLSTKTFLLLIYIVPVVQGTGALVVVTGALVVVTGALGLGGVVQVKVGLY